LFRLLIICKALNSYKKNGLVNCYVNIQRRGGGGIKFQYLIIQQGDRSSIANVFLHFTHIVHIKRGVARPYFHIHGTLICTLRERQAKSANRLIVGTGELSEMQSDALERRQQT
jgi:hypothetical protein